MNQTVIFDHCQQHKRAFAAPFLHKQNNPMKKLLQALALPLLLATATQIQAQDDVMMQAFYWDVPVDVQNQDGTWWDNLRDRATVLEKAGFTGIWVPPPSKGNFGIIDMGYGIFDPYDLGEFDQKGTVETRFGSRKELHRMMSKMHDKGIEVYADVILNHLYTNEEQEEVNPAVKDYVFDEAFRNGNQFSPYPTNEIKWVIKDAQPGDYFIQIHGYFLNSPAKGDRGYDLQIDYAGTGFTDDYIWEFEPNNGFGNFNEVPASGTTIRGHVEVNDVDEYKLSLAQAGDVIIRLTAKKEVFTPGFEWVWANQTNGFYPRAIWYNGQNIALTQQLEARTNTRVDYVQNKKRNSDMPGWDYSNFHPVDQFDFLGFPGTDEIITNTKFFGNDLNTFDPYVQERYKNWGRWLAEEIGFDGFRMDFVRGFQPSYAADWVNALPKDSTGAQRFIVGEYWGPDYRIRDWVNSVASDGADVDGFDFPLKFTLSDMMNRNGGNFDMRWLNHAGLVRNNAGNSLPGTGVVTWIENHDTGKEHDKWVTRDWKMGYAYILTHEGRPCVFYNHFFGDVLTDNHDPSLTVTPDATLRADIQRLIFARRTYLDGSLEVLSETGNPFPAGDAYDVYVARRQGAGDKPGAIIAINNNDSQTKGLWVDANPAGYANWAGEILVNAFNPAEETEVFPDGRVYIAAPARGYAIYVRKSDYVPYADEVSKHFAKLRSGAEALPVSGQLLLEQNFPNPAGAFTTLRFEVPAQGKVRLVIYDLFGRSMAEPVNGIVEAGLHQIRVDTEAWQPGMYFIALEYEGRKLSKRMSIR